MAIIALVPRSTHFPPLAQRQTAFQKSLTFSGRSDRPD